MRGNLLAVGRAGKNDGGRKLVEELAIRDVRERRLQ